ncbi:hypothetical protein SMU10_09508, partial [Streptococcus mutans 8ID3]
RKSRQEVKWISDYFFQTLLVIDTPRPSGYVSDCNRFQSI